MSTARIYDSIYVRHWDHYVTPEFNAVFSGSLKKDGSKYKFDGELHNLVSPIKHAECPIQPFGEASDYDLSPDGKSVAFLSKAPELPKANYTTSYIFIGPHDGSSTAKPINGPDSSGTPKGIAGISSGPTFSPDGKEIAYMQMADETYEADRTVIYVCTLKSGKIRSVAGNWDRSPSTVKWTDDGKTFYMSAEDKAVVKLFSLPTDADDDYEPKPLKVDGSVSTYKILSDDAIFVSSSAIWSSMLYSIAHPKGGPKKLFYSNEHDPELKGLGPDDIDEFWYDGHRVKVSYPAHIAICFSVSQRMRLVINGSLRTKLGSSSRRATARTRNILLPFSSTGVRKAHGATAGVLDGTPKPGLIRVMLSSLPTPLAVRDSVRS